MFSPDVVSMRQFYATPFGDNVRALIAKSLEQLWPSVPGDAMMSVGFATPYLEADLSGNALNIVCMPAGQGAAYWPVQGENRVFLAHESEIPLPEGSVNRVLLIHSIEHSEHLDGLVKEIYRVLTPSGRMLAIVPNRLGLWARSPRTPFGYGRPFSMMQMRELLAGNELTVTRSRSALFIPPTHLRLVWKCAAYIEWIGKLLCPFIGGVLMVEAEKQLYAGIQQPVLVRPRYVPATAMRTPALGMEYSEENN